MSMVIGEDRMTSRDTPHTAIRHGDRWEVSWLPARELTRNEAITAMTLAWQVTKDACMHGERWPFIVVWAGELGLSGHEAVKLCQGAPGTCGGTA